MRRVRRSWVRVVALAAGATALFLVGGHPSAQTQGRGAPGGRLADVSADEVAPRLVVGPNGETLRLWNRRADLRDGGGGVFLAVAAPSNTWKTLLEILPRDAGITTLTPDVGVGPSGELAVAYQWRRHMPRAKQIRLANSVDGGKTWIQSATPVDTASAAFTPKVGWGRGRSVVVVWADERRQDRAWDIYARRSPDGGVTWEPEQVLSRFPQSLATDIYARPELVSDGQNGFWVVWVGLRSGRSRLYLSRSTDGGRTWADPVELSGASQSVFGHRLLRSGDRMLLVWQDTRLGRDRLFAVSSSDGGATWTSPTRVDHLPDDAVTDAVAPSAVMSPSGEVFVAWNDGRNSRDDVFIARSLDGGRTWEKEDMRLDMDEPGTAYSRFPVVGRASDGRIAVAWEDDRVGYEGIHLRVRSTGDRAGWGPEVVVVSPVGKKAARFPGLLWGKDGALNVTWEVWDYTLGPQAVTKRIDGRTLSLDK